MRRRNSDKVDQLAVQVDVILDLLGLLQDEFGHPAATFFGKLGRVETFLCLHVEEVFELVERVQLVQVHRDSCSREVILGLRCLVEAGEALVISHPQVGLHPKDSLQQAPIFGLFGQNEVDRLAAQESDDRLVGTGHAFVHASLIHESNNRLRE